MTEVVTYQVEAFNPSAASENRIHADDVARRYGFRGGLVPGVTVYGYLCHPIVRTLGESWLDRGTLRVKFVAPCYEGETLTSMVTPSPDASAVAVQAKVDHRACAVGTATVIGDLSPTLDLPSRPAPARQERPEASTESLAPGRILGSIPLATDPDTARGYLAMIGEALGLYQDGGVIHPGMLIQAANWVLVANVVLPAWVHVDTEMRHRRRVLVGEPIEVRAQVADGFNRRGHDYVALDVNWLADDEVVASARHTAIWHLAEPENAPTSPH
ncbi:MAG: hypothetical protein M3R71_01695 [Actinomycetota bacterium]|nr:hypothetical protein [Actinomycetota bacterium]